MKEPTSITKKLQNIFQTKSTIHLLLLGPENHFWGNYFERCVLKHRPTMYNHTNGYLIICHFH